MSGLSTPVEIKLGASERPFLNNNLHWGHESHLVSISQIGSEDSHDDGEKTMRAPQSIKYMLLEGDEEDSTRPRTTGSILERLTRPLTLIALALIVLAQILILYALQHVLSQASIGSLRVKTPFPNIPQEIKSFRRETIYFNRSNPETDAAWDALSGPSHGFVHVSEPGRFSLRPGAKDGTIYSIGMFHQLHCLSRIRKMIWDLAEMRVDGAEFIRLTPNDTSQNYQGGPIHGFWEVQHCMDYLRQSIQCAGDVALEWPIQADGEILFVGWDTLHECRSLDAINAFVSSNS